MNMTADAVKDIKKIIEFYQMLGFERHPVKKSDLSGNKDHVFIDRMINNQITKELHAFMSNKENALKKLEDEIGLCQRCRLSKERTNIVFGEGNPDAELMFAGEGPGREEDIQARPFVGEAGKVLTNLITKMGLKRSDVYIANIVKCRPPSNRDPEEDEMNICSQFLEKQIDIIKPKVIIALGRISAHILTGSRVPISKLRGMFYSYKGIDVMPTFHPAYLLRNPKDKWLTWGDVQKVLERLKK